MRMVFDASAKNSGAISLNDNLLKGPKNTNRFNSTANKVTAKQNSFSR